MDLYSIEYLQEGSPRQQRAYAALFNLQLLSILERLSESSAVLAGSVPLDLAVDDSDLDIVTSHADLKTFSGQLRETFGANDGFQSSRGIVLGVPTLVTKFTAEGEHFEIFTQSIPIPRQNAVLHLLIEERLLLLGGSPFREAVMLARRRGFKTEPAFADVLGLERDPYRELLDLEDLTDSEIRSRFSQVFNR